MGYYYTLGVHIEVQGGGSGALEIHLDNVIMPPFEAYGYRA